MTKEEKLTDSGIREGLKTIAEDVAFILADQPTQVKDALLARLNITPEGVKQISDKLELRTHTDNVVKIRRDFLGFLMRT